MRLFLKCSVCLIFAAPLFAQAAGDDAAIRGMVQKYMDARENNNPRAIEALFTSDADQLVSSGEWRKGRSEVVKGSTMVLSDTISAQGEFSRSKEARMR